LIQGIPQFNYRPPARALGGAELVVATGNLTLRYQINDVRWLLYVNDQSNHPPG
jgi:hypothetical protein